MTGSSALGKDGWGLLYLPPVSMGYLVINLPAALGSTTTVTARGASLLTWLLAAVTLFLLYGSMRSHGLLRAIHGREGPAANPKRTNLVKRHMVALTLGLPESKIPEWESNWGMVLAIADCIREYDIGFVCAIRIVPPLGLGMFNPTIIVALVVSLYIGEQSFAGGVLLLGMVVLWWRPRVWSDLPDWYDQNDFPIDTPEYETAEVSQD